MFTEIYPVSAQHSGTDDANRTIDKNYETGADSKADSDGKSWLRIDLGGVWCVHRIVWYRAGYQLHLEWTCTETGCLCTDGDYCDRFRLTVLTVGTMPGGLLNGANCMKGDTVMLEKIIGERFAVYEMSFTGYTAVSTME